MSHSHFPHARAKARACSFRGASLLPVLSALLAVTVCPAQVVFDDVTEGSGVEYTGESYGASWGDMNNDGLPDLYVNHHRNPSGLYVNRGDRTFLDRSAEIDSWQITPRSDVHGAAWADYNNDGHLDLFVTAGSKNNSQFLVNDGTTLSDRIHDFTFEVKSWGGRFPFWFDYDSDGLLDLGVVVQAAKINLHRQVGNDFVKVNAASGHECTNGDYSLLSDLTMDGRVDWVCVTAGTAPERIYDLTAGLPFLEMTSLATKVNNITDVAIADLDGDLLMDLFALRGKVRLNGASITAANAVEGHFATLGAQASGLTFRSAGDLSVELHWSKKNVSRVFIGAGGLHPPQPGTGEPIRMQLSASDPDVHGLVNYNSATDHGVFVGYNPATETWTYVHSAGGTSTAAYSFLSSTAPISNLGTFGIPTSHKPIRPALLKYAGTTYTNQVVGSGLDRNELCVSVAAYDFDNDMDVDLYYVCRDAVLNIANRLYLNDGTGRFVPAAAPFGAEGPVGAGVGLGENVVASDFDVDGSVDLFIMNGLALYPEEPYGHGGPDRLFRNQGNDNALDRTRPDRRDVEPRRHRRHRHRDGRRQVTAPGADGRVSPLGTARPAPALRARHQRIGERDGPVAERPAGPVHQRTGKRTVRSGRGQRAARRGDAGAGAAAPVLACVGYADVQPERRPRGLPVARQLQLAEMERPRDGRCGTDLPVQRTARIGSRDR